GRRHAAQGRAGRALADGGLGDAGGVGATAAARVGGAQAVRGGRRRGAGLPAGSARARGGGERGGPRPTSGAGPLSKRPREGAKPALNLRGVACEVRHTPRTKRDAGGSRTHFVRFAGGRLAVRPQRRSVSPPGIEPGPRPSDGRMLPSTPRGQPSPVPPHGVEPCPPALQAGVTAAYT